MNELLEISEIRIGKSSSPFSRLPHVGIDWTNRLLAIIGARGAGKTTLVLHQLATRPEHSRLYLSLDHLWFQRESLYATLRAAYDLGFRDIALDEVHKYPNWSIEVKNIYDIYDDVHLIITGSSALQIFQSEADLSRRALVYTLPVLSWREFLELEGYGTLPHYALDDLLKGHIEIAREVSENLESPLKLFRNYLISGCFPFYREHIESYPIRLMQTVNMVLETEIPAVTNIPYNSVHRLKKLLAFIATSVPYKPNISSLAGLIEANRETTLIYLDYLRRARLIRMVNLAGKSMGPLSKPEKIYLDNPNMCYALGRGIPDAGNLRETAFLSMISVRHQADIHRRTDFLVDNTYSFEVGGRGKTGKQVKDIENAWIAADDLAIGYSRTIPLWLFGLLR